MQKLIECVPNFSEGRVLNVIRPIADAIQSVNSVSPLDGIRQRMSSLIIRLAVEVDS